MLLMFKKIPGGKIVLFCCFSILLLLNFSCSKNESIVNSNQPKQFAASDSKDNFKKKISPNTSLFERNLPDEIIHLMKMMKFQKEF